jgi:hypothetical protein
LPFNPAADNRRGSFKTEATSSLKSPDNSWDPAQGNPDPHAPRLKRMKVAFWKLLPLKPLL